MQANGQYGVPPEAPQYGVGRGLPSHSHMFNLSHDVSLSPSSGHGHPHHGHHSPHPHQHQQHLQQQHPHHQQQHLQQPSQHSQLHTQSQQVQQEHAHQQPVQRQPPQHNQILPPHHNQDIQQNQMVQQLGLGHQESPKALSPIASRPPPSNINNVLTAVTDQPLVLEDHDGLGEEGERGAAGNRWPRQETLALLDIRSDMDATFRDSSLKGPLWEEISRKLAEMGYQRSARKCKEKFENLHKYYKRTKDGKAGRQDGKSYRFFSQLEALYGNANEPSNTANSNAPSMFAGGSSRNVGILGGSVAVAPGSGATNAPQLDRSGSFLLTRGPLAGPSADTRSIPQAGYRPVLDDSGGLNFSSGSSEDEDEEDPRDSSEMPESRKRKRSSGGKLMAFFESQLKKLLEKQEQLQQKFLDALERRDHDRMIREEAWKRQELARMSREHELNAQERSLAATKDAALVAFLQKVTGQTFQLPPIAIPTHQYPVHSTTPVDTVHAEDHSDRDVFDPSSKRWPKPEVLALIKLRSDLQPKFADPGPKSPLWHEVSGGMSSLGYSRSAKRCKEKWENINKYFKKAKDSSKKRPENAKTCPYFHQLDALYRKGILGSPSHTKQLPYKVTDLPEDELVSQQHQASGSHRDDISGQVLAIMPAEPNSAVAEATTSTTNVGGMAATHVFSFTGESGTINDRGLKKVKMKPTGQIDLGSGDVPLGAATPNYEGLNIGAKIISGSHAVRQASSSDLGKQPEEATRTDSQLQHEQPSSMDRPEYEKMDLEREARLVEQQETHQQSQLQYDPKERPPSLPATRDSSLMALHAQKFSSDPATESNVSTSANS